MKSNSLVEPTNPESIRSSPLGGGNKEEHARLVTIIQNNLLDKVIVSNHTLITWPIELTSMHIYSTQNMEIIPPNTLTNTNLSLVTQKFHGKDDEPSEAYGQQQQQQSQHQTTPKISLSISLKRQKRKEVNDLEDCCSLSIQAEVNIPYCFSDEQTESKYSDRKSRSVSEKNDRIFKEKYPSAGSEEHLPPSSHRDSPNLKMQSKDSISSPTTWLKDSYKTDISITSVIDLIHGKMYKKEDKDGIITTQLEDNVENTTSLRDLQEHSIMKRIPSEEYEKDKPFESFIQPENILTGEVFNDFNISDANNQEAYIGQISNDGFKAEIPTTLDDNTGEYNQEDQTEIYKKSFQKTLADSDIGQMQEDLHPDKRIPQSQPIVRTQSDVIQPTRDPRMQNIVDNTRHQSYIDDRKDGQNTVQIKSNKQTLPVNISPIGVSQPIVQTQFDLIRPIRDLQMQSTVEGIQHTSYTDESDKQFPQLSMAPPEISLFSSTVNSLRLSSDVDEIHDQPSSIRLQPSQQIESNCMLTTDYLSELQNTIQITRSPSEFEMNQQTTSELLHIQQNISPTPLDYSRPTSPSSPRMVNLCENTLEILIETKDDGEGIKNVKITSELILSIHNTGQNDSKLLKFRASSLLPPDFLCFKQSSQFDKSDRSPSRKLLLSSSSSPPLENNINTEEDSLPKWSIKEDTTIGGQSYPDGNASLKSPPTEDQKRLENSQSGYTNLLSTQKVSLSDDKGKIHQALSSQKSDNEADIQMKAITSQSVNSTYDENSDTTTENSELFR
uniref:Uncharacterized protein n=1 Tax=Trichobilharzia regenti TaxID=157069 RepID=A0AA85J1M8_TRIRE|nr:unnamed protein product [Trichobilharzia regenti]